MGEYRANFLPLFSTAYKLNLKINALNEQEQLSLLLCLLNRGFILNNCQTSATITLGVPIYKLIS